MWYNFMEIKIAAGFIVSMFWFESLINNVSENPQVEDKYNWEEAIQIYVTNFCIDLFSL